MKYLYVKQTVEDFNTWYDVFKSHEQAQKDAGLTDLQLFRDSENPNIILCIFKVTDIEKAKAFTSSPESEKAQKETKMIEKPEVIWLDKI